MSIKINDGSVVIAPGRDSGIEIRVPLEEFLDAIRNADDDSFDLVVECITEDKILDKAIERICGTSLHYSWPTDQRRGREVLLATEQRVLGTSIWGSFDDTEAAICREILKDDTRGLDLPYATRDHLITLAHKRARRIRGVVAAKMKELVESVRKEVPSE